MRILQQPNTVLNGVTANGAGVHLEVKNYEHIALQLSTTGNTAATIKIAVSNSLKAPNFSASPSATNIYDYVDLTPYNGQTTPITGGTGIVLTGTDVVKLYSIDTNFVRWICPIVSGYSAGTITATLDAAANWTR